MDKVKGKVKQVEHVLPSLLMDVVDDHPYITRFYDWQNKQWQGYNALELKQSVEELALGLRSLGLQPEDKIAFLLQSNLDFIIADLASLLAGLVNVPIDLTQTIENIVYTINHCKAKTLIISNLSLLDQILPYLRRSHLKYIIITTTEPHWSSRGLIEEQNNCEVISLSQIKQQGKQKQNNRSWESLIGQLKPENLATIIYIAGDKQEPKGVMLTHKNIMTNIMTSFDTFVDIAHDASEIALSFLPLTHIFARSFFYGHLYSGHQVYFSSPNQLTRHLLTVKPTILITVPLLLEKLYQKILQKGSKQKGWQKYIFQLGINLVNRYRLDRKTHLPIKLISKFIFKSVKASFGGNLKVLISGGASLNPQLGHIFTGMGLPLIQGYGLTETSGVVTYTRRYEGDNSAETVGKPIAGVEIKIADDGEVLIKSPFVFQGYYRDSELTSNTLQSGWLYTGDLGRITPSGTLKLTGVKKAHFKLSTGKYVCALPLTRKLQSNSLIKTAIVLAPNYPFCSVLIMPDFYQLWQQVSKMGLYLDEEDILQHSCIQALYQKAIDETNCHLPYWSHVRKFKLISHCPENLTDKEVIQLFSTQINDLYAKSTSRNKHRSDLDLSCPTVQVYSCPTYAQSIQH